MKKLSKQEYQKRKELLSDVMLELNMFAQEYGFKVHITMEDKDGNSRSKKRTATRKD